MKILINVLMEKSIHKDGSIIYKTLINKYIIAKPYIYLYI